MHFMRGHLNGNPYLGIFACANQSHLFAPIGAHRKAVQAVANVLVAQPIYTTVAGTELIGTLMVANSEGVLLPPDATEIEIKTISQAVKGRVGILDSRHNALGNLIVANDNGAVVADVYGREEVNEIEATLGVEVRKGTINNLNLVGSLCRATNTAALTSPSASDREIKLIKDTLNVRVERGTANFGVTYVGACILANSEGVVAGTPTTGIEMGKIEQVFEGETW